MTDDDLFIAIELARDRLPKHGRAMLHPQFVVGAIIASTDQAVLKLDGEPVILHYDMHNPSEVVSYAIDKTLTLGQFIDGLNTTLTVLYGNPQSIPQVKVQSAGHTHQMHPGQPAYIGGPIGVSNAAPPGGRAYLADEHVIDWSSNDLTFMGKPIKSLTPSEVQAAQEIVRQMKEKPSALGRLKDLFR